MNEMEFNLEVKEKSLKYTWISSQINVFVSSF